MSIEYLKSIFEIASYLATAFGIPIAIYLYFDEKRKERLDRESVVFDSLDQWYSEFLKLNFENKDLAAIYYAPFINGNNPDPELNDDQKIRQVLYFEMLTSILERAFLIYRNQNGIMKLKRWKGWNEYMYDWMRVKQFREVWQWMGAQWDEDFISHMNNIKIEVEKEILLNEKHLKE